MTITLIAMVLVFGSYLLWTGFVNWLDTGTAQTRDRQATAAAGSTATSEAVLNRPRPPLFPTNTPIPPCQFYTVRGPEAAWVRECPSTNCDQVTYLEPRVQVCVIGRANNPDYAGSNEWFEIMLEPDAIIPEIVYMHEITLRSNNPTATPRPTRETLPTITPTPRPSRPAVTPLPSITPTPPITPSPTAPQIEI